MLKPEEIKTVWEFPYSGDDDPRIGEDMRVMEQRFDAFAADFKPHNEGNKVPWLEDPVALRLALDRWEEIQAAGAAWGWPRFYAALRNFQDKNNPSVKALLGRVRDWSNHVYNKGLFFTLLLGRIPIEAQERMLQAPDLEPYRHYLEKIFLRAPHLLSEETEQALTLIELIARDNWSDMLSDLTSKEEVEVLLENGTTEKMPRTRANGLLKSQNQEVRDRANAAILNLLGKRSDIAEYELNNAVLAFRKVNDDLRKFTRPDASTYLADDIEAEVVDSLITAVRSRYDISHRFMELKAALMGHRPIGFYELFVPYGPLGQKYSFVEAATIAHEVMAQLHPRFGEIMARQLTEGRVDALPKTGKRGGAFHWRLSKGLPAYLLFNHNETLGDVIDIAHESGHAIHYTLAAEAQNAMQSRPPHPLAEVGSTFFEDFVIAELLRTADKEMQLSLLLMKLDSDVQNIFYVTAEYDFERATHELYREKGRASGAATNRLYREHLSAYLGKAVDTSSGELRWITRDHIRSYFYNYSYALAYLVSKVLQRLVREAAGNISKVIDIFSAGSSESPRNILLRAGIDLLEDGFWARGLQEVENLLNEAEVLARRLGKVPEVLSAG